MLLNFCLMFLVLVRVFAIKNRPATGLVYKTPCCWKVNYDVPEIYLKTPNFIEINGFVAETHMVTTEDGYLLTVHRILGRQSAFIDNEILYSHRPAVLMQHGIIGSSDNWFLNGEKSFPFLLSNSGYDVWIGDSRGNNYSQGHLWLSPKNIRYWDFSFHEQGYYDMAAMTDYVINVTGQKKIFYIGHSRGTTMAYVLLSTRPEYNEKFHLMVGLAPVAYVKHMRSPILQSVFNSNLALKLQNLGEPLRILPLPGLSEKSIAVRLKLCAKGSPTQSICVRLIFALSGDDYELFNTAQLPLYVSHFPDGGSVKELIHYLQIAVTDKFRYYDYGPLQNFKFYGQYEPPEYNLENITVPTSIFYGPNDYVVSEEDLQHLDSRLKSTVARYQIPFKKFNHMDFLWATKADVLVYKPALKLMNQFLEYR